MITIIKAEKMLYRGRRKSLLYINHWQRDWQPGQITNVIPEAEPLSLFVRGRLELMGTLRY